MIKYPISNKIIVYFLFVALALGFFLLSSGIRAESCTILFELEDLNIEGLATVSLDFDFIMKTTVPEMKTVFFYQKSWIHLA